MGYRVGLLYLYKRLENKCDNIHYRMNGKFFSIISTHVINIHSSLLCPRIRYCVRNNITIVNYNLIQFPRL